MSKTLRVNPTKKVTIPTRIFEKESTMSDKMTESQMRAMIVHHKRMAKVFYSYGQQANGDSATSHAESLQAEYDRTYKNQDFITGDFVQFRENDDGILMQVLEIRGDRVLVMSILPDWNPALYPQSVYFAADLEKSRLQNTNKGV